MGSLACASMRLFIFATVACLSHARHQTGPAKIFNVMTYGAKADGKTDNSKAFLSAWNDACRWKGRSRVLVPLGTYMLNKVSFKGPCHGDMTFMIRGVLKAPTDPSSFKGDTWIGFRYLSNFALKGSGTLDGQGAAAWPYNDCAKNPHCPALPISLRFDFVNHSRIHYIRSINSKNAHINLFGCHHINISHIRITAPEDSPNTDGIHIGASTNIKIHNAIIATGDDCIALLSGSHDIDIFGVSCGPGHGISIGSIGRPLGGNIEYVTGISIRDSSITGTQNGLRIKTWAPSDTGFVKDFTFENITFADVSNPIFIDQNYCPVPPCDTQAQSSVQISNGTFKNIRGTSHTKNAIQLKCSGNFPCKNIQLVNINLTYKGHGGPATSLCYNVRGVTFGQLIPSGCL